MSGNVFGTPRNNKFFGNNNKNFNPIQDDVFGNRPPTIIIEKVAYVKLFLIPEWIYDPLEDNYSIEIPKSIHQNGNHPLIEVHEYDGIIYTILTMDMISIDNDGNIVIKCNQPFNGKLIINS